MHEYSLVRALLDQVEREAEARSASAVHKLGLKVGALAGVEPELLASAYALCRDGTVCASAELEIETVPARWECGECGRRIHEGAVLSCPACAVPARLTSGDEILLERIEMEVPDVRHLRLR
jgi:hydrogenase nickel incorporation protein HypA/HybF